MSDARTESGWTATTTPELATWLLARIAEDERAAQNAIGCRYTVDYSSSALPVVWHIDRWTSARVLAECDAKRRLIELHTNLNADWDATDAVCTICQDRRWHDAQAWPCPTLRLLALPYADHPDYRDEWRP